MAASEHPLTIRKFRFEGPVTEDPTKQLYRMIKMTRPSRDVAWTEHPQGVYRRASKIESTRADSVVMVEPETYDFVRLVPVEGAADVLRPLPDDRGSDGGGSGGR